MILYILFYFRLKGKNLESIIPEEFNIIEKIHQNLYKTNN